MSLEHRPFGFAQKVLASSIRSSGCNPKVFVYFFNFPADAQIIVEF